MRFILFLLLTIISTSSAQDHIIFGIEQDFPMGEPNEIILKNYYINMGKQQGLFNGATVNIFRNVSISDPYHTKKKYDYSILVGEMKVVHTEEQTAIGSLQSINKMTYLDVASFMIGDKVEVQTE